MNVTVFGSHLCPGTLAALNQLSAAGVDVNFRDILSCHADLRAYLHLRETHEIYADIRGTERLGIPCMICEDGTITMDVEEVLKK